MSDNVEAQVAARAFSEAGLPQDKVEEGPSYRMMADSKIPVSKSRGKLWKSRKDIGRKAMKDVESAWDEAIRYYQHDQSEHRDGNSPTSAGNNTIARRLNNKFASTENVVFANTNAQIPELYAKNPIIELTTEDPENEKDENSDSRKFVAQCEKLVNKLIAKKMAPGVNLKPTAKRNVLMALLTNAAWFEVGYTKRDASSEKTFAELQELGSKLKDAKTPKEIEEIEQQLFALEERTEFLRPAGPYVRHRAPHQIVIDPAALIAGSLHEANWIMIEDMLPTLYINAVYGKPQGEKNEVRSVYEASHILDSGTDPADEKSFTLFQTEKAHSAYGFDDENSFERAKHTKVWYVWDKVTRRLELYSDKNWAWPIWVWDDPYKLDQFFPLVPLAFHDSPTGMYAKGEVSYYLDQQDAINAINDEQARALLWARRNIFFNKNKISQTEVDAVLSGDTEKATPVDVPEGMKMEDLIFSMLPPSANFSQLFDKSSHYKAIDRIAATNDVMRGSEFKTNTTNQAIDYYATQGNKRSDERLDAVEDAIATIGWLLLQMVLNFMDVDTASKLIGEKIDAEQWKPIDPLEPSTLFTVQCVGGSTTKPSRQAKKQEAVQVGQILSQYVRAAPRVVLPISLRMMEEAFDGITIQRQDWEALETAIVDEGGAGGPQGQPGSGDPKQIAIMVTQALSQLPPPVLQAIGKALAQGATPQEILATMMAKDGQQPQQPEQQGAQNVGQ